MLLMVFAIIMSIINLKLYYVCTSLHRTYQKMASACLAFWVGGGGFSAELSDIINLIMDFNGAWNVFNYAWKYVLRNLCHSDLTKHWNFPEGGGDWLFWPIWTNLRFRRLNNIGLSINERPMKLNPHNVTWILYVSLSFICCILIGWEGIKMCEQVINSFVFKVESFMIC